MKHTEPPKPPQWAERLLCWYADPDWQEEILGDLYEAFLERCDAKGVAYARRKYVQDTLKFIKPSVLQRFRVHRQYQPMFKNYLKIAIRSLARRKKYATINAVGLLLGLCCVLLTYLYVQHELTYDRLSDQAENIYRVHNKYREQTYTPLHFKNYWDTDQAAQQLHPEGFEQLSGVVAATHFVRSNTAIAGESEYYVEKQDGKRLTEDYILFTNRGSSFLDIFSWNFLSGDPEEALSTKHQAVLTRASAIKYYGSDWQSNEGILGRTLNIDSTDYVVTAVIEDIPGNSHVKFNIALSVGQVPSWAAYTYLLLNDEASVAEVEAQINDAYYSITPGRRDDPLSGGLSLMPLTDIHLKSNYLYELETPGDIRYLYIFSIIGLVILLITITNYTNLSVALYAGRQKEIGMRKVLGARRGDVSGQFLFEAILLAVFCLPLAVLLLQLILPYFNQLMQLKLTNLYLNDWPFTAGAIGLAILIGMLSGLYPSVSLSGKGLTELFKAKLSSSGTGLGLRRALVGFQLVLLVALGSATLFINQQLNYISAKKLGFDKEGLLYFNIDNTDDYQLLKNKLLTFSGITEVGVGSLPGAEMYNQTTYKLLSGEEILSDGTSLYMDLGMVRALGIDHPLFDEPMAGKDQWLIVNKTAADKLAQVNQVPYSDIVGRVLIEEPEYVDEEGQQGFPSVIDGVIDDFHYFSLKQQITPMFIRVTREPQYLYTVVVKTKSDKLYESIDWIEKEYADIAPGAPFEVKFMEDRLAQLYGKEAQIGKLSTVLSIVAIFLSVLGLVGLVSFMTYQRRSEISVRKVFGASLVQIMLLVNREFIFLVVAATVLATPLAYLSIHAWLANFAYHISPTFLGIATVGLTSLVIVVLVVSFQSFNTAGQNPATTLRDH